MRRITTRQFNRNYHQELSSLPFIVTVRGVDSYIVLEAKYLNRLVCEFDQCESLNVDKYEMKTSDGRGSIVMNLCAVHVSEYVTMGRQITSYNVPTNKELAPKVEVSRNDLAYPDSLNNDVATYSHIQCQTFRCPTMETTQRKVFYPNDEGGVEKEVYLCDNHLQKAREADSVIE